MKQIAGLVVAIGLLAIGRSEGRTRHAERVRGAGLPEAAAAWTETDGAGNGTLFAARRSGGAWTAPEAITTGGAPDCLPSLDFAPDGTGWAVWVRRDGARRLLRAARFDGAAWSDAEAIETGMDLNMAPSVRIEADGTPVVVWAGFDGEDDEIFAARRRDGAWSPPLRVHADNTAPDILPETELDPAGRVRVIWQQAAGLAYRPRAALLEDGRPAADAAVDAARDTADCRARVHALCARAPFRRRALDPVVVIDAAGRRRGVRLTSLSSAVPAAVPRPERDAAGWLLLTFGDSITQGYPYRTSPGNGSASGGYQGFLVLLLDRAGQAAETQNWGLGGEPTVLGVARLQSILAQVPFADKVLIMEGTNDANGGISYETVLYNLDIMVQLAQQAGIEPVLSTLLPSARDKSGIGSLINPGIRNIAANRGIGLCDPYSTFQSLSRYVIGDGIHPTALGYLVLGYYWKEALLLL
jgi:lysophospholipase L1-like esterase